MQSIDRWNKWCSAVIVAVFLSAGCTDDTDAQLENDRAAEKLADDEELAAENPVREAADEELLPEPWYVWIDNSCGVGEERKRLVWAVRYMRAAAKAGPFVTCLRHAVNEGTSLETYQESQWVGPYYYCNWNWTGDPSFGWIYPQLGFEAALATAQTQTRPLKIVCGAAGGSTARALTEYDYFDYANWPHEVIEVSLDVFKRYPDHEPDRPIPTDFGDLGPSYPVDELAGIILHERLHNRGFEHGTEENECGYTDGYNCPADGSRANCRMRSLNEIAEACMSEIVERSIDKCWNSGITCSDSESVPIDFLAACRCVPWQ